jgi:hypothetical protein
MKNFYFILFVVNYLCCAISYTAGLITNDGLFLLLGTTQLFLTIFNALAWRELKDKEELEEAVNASL